MTGSWEEVKQPKPAKATATLEEEESSLVHAETVQDLIEKCMEELRVAHQEKYEEDKASRTAALFLFAQGELSRFISDVELRAKQMKREVERVEAEKYHEYKSQPSNKKVTDVSVANSVAMDEEVLAAFANAAQAEVEAKRLNYIMGTLRDGHHFFKMMAKQKSITDFT